MINLDEDPYYVWLQTRKEQEVAKCNFEPAAIFRDCAKAYAELQGERMPELTTMVYCQLRFASLHNWDMAEGRQAYLRHVHRHEFHVKAYKVVSHLDRDIEFIALKEKMEDYVRDRWERKPISLSCEMIGRDLIDEFGLCKVEVSEDGENGMVMEVQ